MSYVPATFTAGVALVLTAAGAVGGQWVQDARQSARTSASAEITTRREAVRAPADSNRHHTFPAAAAAAWPAPATHDAATGDRHVGVHRQPPPVLRELKVDPALRKPSPGPVPKHDDNVKARADRRAVGKTDTGADAKVRHGGDDDTPDGRKRDDGGDARERQDPETADRRPVTRS